MHSKLETWNAIGKYWLQSKDMHSSQEYFLCTCSDLSPISLNNMSIFYKKALIAYSEFQSKFEPENREEILNLSLFGNKLIQFQGKSLYVESFIKSGLLKIKDIWNDAENCFKYNDTIFNKLLDKRCWIFEYSKIKSAIPKLFYPILKRNSSVSNSETKLPYKLNNNLLIKRDTNKVVTFEDIKLKNIEKILNKTIIPKCQEKWENIYQNNIQWNLVWDSISKMKVKNKIQEFQWKCVHNILYTEDKLCKIGLSNGLCNLCKNHKENQQHLFFHCTKVKTTLKLLEDIIENVLQLNGTLQINQQTITLGYLKEPQTQRNVVNILICIYKWVIWKTRNKIKYEDLKITDFSIKNAFKNEMKSNFSLLQSHDLTNFKEKINHVFQNSL